MGAHESTHVLSMKNDRPVVEITASVHNRLMDQVTKPNSKASERPTVESQEDTAGSPKSQTANNNSQSFSSHEKYSKVEEESQKDCDEFYALGKCERDALAKLKEDERDIPKVFMSPETVVVGVGKGGLPAIETISAVQVREEKDKELRENDKFWSSHLQKLIDLNTQSIGKAHIEYNKKLEELETIAPKLLKPNKCNNLKVLLENCYRQNEGKVLHCSELVNQFNRCVSYEVQEKRSYISEEDAFEIKKSKSL